MSGNNPAYLFVYGSLMNGSGHPLSEELAANFEYLTTGYIQAELYYLDGYPGAVLSEDAADKVHGQIYRNLGNSDAFMNRLNRYEGYYPEAPGKSLFVPETVEVHTPERSITAGCYLYRGSLRGYARIPGGDYLSYLSN